MKEGREIGAGGGKKWCKWGVVRERQGQDWTEKQKGEEKEEKDD